MSGSEEGQGGAISLLKDVADLLKRYGILIIIIVIIFWPKVLVTWFKSSGLKKLVILGAEFTPEEMKSVHNINNDLNDTSQLISNLKTQVNELNGLKNEIIDPKLKQRFEQQLLILTSTLEGTKIQIKQASNQIAPLINKVEAYEKDTEDKWGVVFGGDTTLDAAEHEINIAKNKGFKNPKIYLRKKFYRSIIPFESKEEANLHLEEIRTNIRDSAYIVNLTRWCRSSKKENGYYKCE